MRNLIVLAGGEGRRMGGVDKCTQLLRNKPLFEYVVESANDWVDRTILVGDFYGVPIDGYERLADIHPGQGPMSGLFSLSQQNVQGTLLIAACDMPNLTSKVWSTIIEQYDGQDPVFGTTADSPFLLLIICEFSHLESLAEQFLQGERRVRQWLQHTKAKAVSLDTFAEALINMNALPKE